MLRTRAAVLRLLPSGALDAAFGAGGIATIEPPPSYTGTNAEAMALDASGRIVIAGEVDDDIPAVMRLLPDGAPDPGFGSGGVVVARGAYNGAAAWWQSVAFDGSTIVVAGNAVNTPPYGTGLDRQPVLARFSDAGVPDPSFASGGFLLLELPGITLANPQTLAIDRSGRIVFGAAFATTTAVPREVTQQVIRLAPSGALDTSFGSGGVVALGLLRGRGAHVSVRASGAILVIGGWGRDLITSARDHGRAADAGWPARPGRSRRAARSPHRPATPATASPTARATCSSRPRSACSGWARRSARPHLPQRQRGQRDRRQHARDGATRRCGDDARRRDRSRWDAQRRSQPARRRSGDADRPLRDRRAPPAGRPARPSTPAAGRLTRLHHRVPPGDRVALDDPVGAASAGCCSASHGARAPGARPGTAGASPPLRARRRRGVHRRPGRARGVPESPARAGSSIVRVVAVDRAGNRSPVAVRRVSAPEARAKLPVSSRAMLARALCRRRRTAAA